MREGDKVLIQTMSRGRVLESRESVLTTVNGELGYTWKGFHIPLKKSTATVTLQK